MSKSNSDSLMKMVQAAQASMEDKEVSHTSKCPEGKENPLAAMTQEELQEYCRRRLDELLEGIPEKRRNRVTVALTVVERTGDPSTRCIVITTSKDDGTLPRGAGPLKPNEELRTPRPNLRIRVERGEDGEPIKERIFDKKNGKWKTRSKKIHYDVDPDTGEARPYIKKKKGQAGETAHHAEQKGLNSLTDDEEVVSLVPSRECCDDCRIALGDELSKVPKDLRGD